MKKFLYAAMAATVLFASCAKDGNEGGANNGGPAEEAKLSINIDAPASRAQGTVPGNDNTVANFTVFITDKSTGDINPAWTTYSSTGTNLTGNDAISVTTNAADVYVLANAGDQSAITTLANLTSFKADLNGTGSQTATRWASGKTASALSFTQSGSNWSASTTVTLQFIAARITVTVDNQMTGYGGAGSLTLNDVAIMNARGESLLFPASGTSLIPATYTLGKKFYQGLANPASPDNFANYPATTDYTMASVLLSDNLVSPIVATDTYYYYVFENDAAAATDFPTIITLVGVDGNSDPLYWPVHLTGYEQWAAAPSAAFITRGHSYNVNIKLTGDATNGGGGTTDPTKPVVTASVEVSVSITDWIPVPLEKEFN